jgi:DNA-directed RNA polymerase sigma subunit (sigma70/sigma32)
MTPRQQNSRTRLKFPFAQNAVTLRFRSGDAIMSKELNEGLARVEQETHQIVEAVGLQNEQIRVTIARLDEIIALLTPKDDAGEPTLSDLLAHLIAQNREQLILSRKTIDFLVDMQKSLPDKTVEALEKRFSSLAKA